MLDIWELDEVHFQQHGTRPLMWVPPEVKDPVPLYHPTRKGVGYFGAVNVKYGRLIYKCEEDCFNAQSFWEFLEQLKTSSSKTGVKVVPIIDNAKYHHTKLHKEWRGSVMDEFELEFLPPYSPDLNSIERVWKLIRRKCLHNKYFSCLSLLIETAENQFNTWAEPKEILRSYTQFNPFAARSPPPLSYIAHASESVGVG